MLWGLPPRSGTPPPTTTTSLVWGIHIGSLIQLLPNHRAGELKGVMDNKKKHYEEKRWTWEIWVGVFGKKKTIATLWLCLNLSLQRYLCNGDLDAVLSSFRFLFLLCCSPCTFLYETHSINKDWLTDWSLLSYIALCGRVRLIWRERRDNEMVWGFFHTVCLLRRKAQYFVSMWENDGAFRNPSTLTFHLFMGVISNNL